MTPNQTLVNLAEKISRLFIQSLQKLDPEAYATLAPFEGKILQLAITDFNLNIFFKVYQNEIKVSTALKNTEAPSTTLSGKFLDIISLTFMQSSNMSVFKQKNMTITGDTSFLMTLNKTFTDIDIDWEEHLSYFIGDFAAHNLNNMLKTSINWLQNTKNNRARDLTLFLQEEIKLLPTQIEMEHHYQDINDIKVRVEKLEKRLKQLKQG